MKLDTLQYDDRDFFYFRSQNGNASKIRGVFKFLTDDGMGWAFPAAYPDGYLALKDLKMIIPSARAVHEAMPKILALKNTPDDIADLKILKSINYDFKYPPRTNQAEAIENMFYFRRLAILASMGLGKTYISLMHIQLMKILLGRPYRALVCAPKIVLRNWFEETLRFTDLKPVLYRGTKKQREAIRGDIENGNWDLVITNYEMITPRKGGTDHAVFLQPGRFDVVIMDEASKLRGLKSENQRCAAMEKVCANIDRRYPLSGALSLGKPTDLFRPFKIMHPPVLGSNYYKFRAQYCRVSPYNKHIITGFKNLDILKERVSPYSLIQVRDECIDLPPRTFSKLYYELTSEQRSLYNRIVNDSVVEIGDDEIVTELAVVKLTKLSQLLSGFILMPPPRNDDKCNVCRHMLNCIEKNIYPWQTDCLVYDPGNPVEKPSQRHFALKSNPKLKCLSDQLDDIGDERVIIWAKYRLELDHISGLLDKKRLSYITPETPDSDVVFREQSDIRVYLGQVSQGIGTTLNDAHIMIYYSNSLDLEHRLQSLERNYRIGQESKVVVHDIIAEDTIESSILELLEAKENMKTYFQSRNVCNTCRKWEVCMARRVTPYSDACIHADERKRVEKKHTIPVNSLKTSI